MFISLRKIPLFQRLKICHTAIPSIQKNTSPRHIIERCIVIDPIPFMTLPTTESPWIINTFGGCFSTNTFTILVNDTSFPIPIIDAISLSPAIQEQLLVDSCAMTFSISNSNIIPSIFPFLHRLLHDSNPLFEHFDLNSASSLSRSLLNSAIEHLLFSSLPFDASKLSQLSLEALDSFLSSETFSIENEDLLLEFLLELGTEYLPLLSHLQICYLSSNGLSKLASNLVESTWTSAKSWMSLSKSLIIS
jgi:hypothetical protein